MPREHEQLCSLQDPGRKAGCSGMCLESRPGEAGRLWGSLPVRPSLINKVLLRAHVSKYKMDVHLIFDLWPACERLVLRRGNLGLNHSSVPNAFVAFGGNFYSIK